MAAAAEAGPLPAAAAPALAPLVEISSSGGSCDEVLAAVPPLPLGDVAAGAAEVAAAELLLLAGRDLASGSRNGDLGLGSAAGAGALAESLPRLSASVLPLALSVAAGDGCLSFLPLAGAEAAGSAAAAAAAGFSSCSLQIGLISCS